MDSDLESNFKGMTTILTQGANGRQWKRFVFDCLRHRRSPALVSGASNLEKTGFAGPV